MIPALAPLDPRSAYLFYDCQTDDSRLVLTVLGEAERYGAVMLNGAEVTEVLESDGVATGVAFTEAESGERMEVMADLDHQRDRRLGRPDPPRGRRGGGRAADRAEPRDARAARLEDAADGGGGLHRARRARAARSSPCPGTGGR